MKRRYLKFTICALIGAAWLFLAAPYLSGFALDAKELRPPQAQASDIDGPYRQSATATPPAVATVAGPSATLPVATAAPPGEPASWLDQWLPSDRDETRKIVLAAVLTAAFTLLVVFFRQVASFVSRLSGKLWAKLRVERSIDSHYRKRLARELRTIQILQMPEGKALQTFFVPLRLVSWIEPELLEPGGVPRNEPIHLSEALQNYSRITIVGNPGAGKTTVSSDVTAGVAEGSVVIRGKKYLPIFVQLRALRDFLESDKHATKSLHDLASEALERHGFANAREMLTRKLHAGECLLVLDGFDELADHDGTLQQRLANKVKDLADSADSENRLVLTSRSAGYVPAWFAGFAVLEMTELSPEQAKQFAQGWFGAGNQARAGKLCSALDESPRLQLLAANPLMMAIICYVYGTRPSDDDFIPRRRVDLYDRCVEALIVEWDRSRGVRRDALFPNQEIETVLCHVAYEALQQGQIDFSREALLTMIRTNLPKANRRIYEDGSFLEEVLEHTGLFKVKGRDKVGFLHLTFQEYLAAQVIAEQVQVGAAKKALHEELAAVVANAINPAWQEPIALAAGILRGRPELITILFEEYQRQPSPELEALMGICLRDAELEDFNIAPHVLLIQDEVISKLVTSAIDVSAP